MKRSFNSFLSDDEFSLDEQEPKETDFDQLLLSRSGLQAYELSGHDAKQLTETATKVKERFSGYPVSRVLESMIVHYGRTYIKYEKPSSLRQLCQLAAHLAERQAVSLHNLRSVAESLLPPAYAWPLHNHHILPLGLQLGGHGTDFSSRVKGFIDSLFRLCLDDGDMDTANGVLGALMALADSNSRTEVEAQNASLILDKLLGKILNWIHEDGEIDVGRLSLSDVPEHVKYRWAVHETAVMLQHRPMLKIGEAIKQQINWKFTVDSSLGSLCSLLLTTVCQHHREQSVEAAANVLDVILRVVNNKEVNWKAVLSMISIGIQIVQGLESCLAEKIDELLSSGLELENKESVYLGMLLARQACLYSTQLFPSYSAWFHSKFGSEASTLAVSKKAQAYLMSQLEALIEWEPNSVLRVHIERPPSLSRLSKDRLESFKQIVRTVLIDRGAKQTQVEIIPPSNEILEKVKEIVIEWSVRGKVPAFLSEANMFRQPYYESKLLPGLLLAKMDSKQLQDSQSRLIEHLHARGKIPAALYSHYKEGILLKNSPESEAGLPTLDSLRAELEILVTSDGAEALGRVSKIKTICMELLAETKPVHVPFTMDLLTTNHADTDDVSKTMHDVLVEFAGKLRGVEEIYPLFVGHPALTRHTYRHLLTTTSPNDLTAKLFCAVVTDSSLPLISTQGGPKPLQDVILSPEHCVRGQAHLATVIGWIERAVDLPIHSSLSTKWNLVLGYYKHRNLFVERKVVAFNLWTNRSVSFFKDVLQIEVCLQPEKDFLSSGEKLLFYRHLFKSCSLPEPAVLRELLKVCAAVCTLQPSCKGQLTLAIMAGTYFCDCPDTWLEAWAQTSKRSDMDAAILVELISLLPDKIILSMDLAKMQQLLEDAKSDLRFFLPLLSTSLLVKRFSVEYSKIDIPKLTRLSEYSLCLWSGLGKLELPPILTFLPTVMDLSPVAEWPSWCQAHKQTSQFEGSYPSKALQVGLLCLAEEIAEGQEEARYADTVAAVKLCHRHVGTPLDLEQPLDSSFSALLTERLGDFLVLALTAVNNM